MGAEGSLVSARLLQRLCQIFLANLHWSLAVQHIQEVAPTECCEFVSRDSYRPEQTSSYETVLAVICRGVGKNLTVQLDGVGEYSTRHQNSRGHGHLYHHDKVLGLDLDQHDRL